MASSARINELRKKFEENPRRYFAPLANEYRKAGDIEQAVAICREYLPQQPGHMSGHIVYGQALYEARQVEEARTVFETALSLDPENLIALRHLGDIALMVGDAPAARMWYGRVLEADPRNEEILAQLAAVDQAASAAPTPVVAASVPAAQPAAPAAPAKPTPSSAPTVVLSAQPRPDAPKPPPKQEPVERPLETVTPESPTAEIRLETLPTAAPSDVEKSVDMTLGLEPTSVPQGPPPAEAPTLEIDVPISAQREAPPIDSFSLAGLETTSMASSAPGTTEPPAAEPLADLDFGVAAAPPPAIPTLDLAEPTVNAAPPVPAESAAPASEPVAELPLLDIGELPAAASTSPAAEPPPVPEIGELEAPTAAAPETPVLEEWTPPVAPEAVVQETAAVPESGPFVTETMAALYLQQGHREEALRMYRALLDQRPGDASLIAKIAELAPHAAPVLGNGPTIRELLNAIAIRRPGFRPEPLRENGAEPQAGAPVAVASHSDALAMIFGGGQIAPADEAAAISLAQAFMDLDGLEGGGDTASLQLTGAPARRASNDLSLDTVFKTGAGEAAPPSPSSFSFDQFFSPRATSDQAAHTSVPAPGGRGASDDVAQFTQWLEGLKQR